MALVKDDRDASTETIDIANSEDRTENLILPENEPMELGSTKEDRAEIYEKVDRMFFENIVEYTDEPYKLISKLKDEYKDKFKSWKSLHVNNVKHGDLVYMRGMVLYGNETEFALSVVITQENDGNTRTVCGILRNCMNCSNIKEVKSMSTRNVYVFVPEPGVTDWYYTTFSGRNSQQQTDVFFNDTNLKVVAKFYDKESDSFGPNKVFDLYGIVDLTEKALQENPENVSAKSSGVSTASLHVIHYEPVEYCKIVASAYPEVLIYKIISGINTILHAFEVLFDSRIAAELLVCQLITSRHSNPQKSTECTLPYSLKNVHNSKPIIEMIKLFMPKVHVIEVVEGTMEKSWASYSRSDESFEQGLLQVSDNTLIIIDETKLPSRVLPYTKEGQENCRLVANFLSTKKIPFIFPYQTVEIDSDVTVLVLSGEKCFLGLEGLAMIAPKSYEKSVDFVRQYAAEHENELNLCRHALLACRANMCNISIGESVEKEAVQSFVEMQKINRNVDGNVARLHRQLIISKLLTSLNDEKTVEKDCWKRATELENELRVTAERPLY